MDRQLERVPVIVCSAALRVLSDLQGYLTEQKVMIVVKPFVVTQLEEAVLQALMVEGHGGAPNAADLVEKMPA